MSDDAWQQREKGFETKYQLDENIRFKVTVRRNKLFGLWAAGEMGLAGGGAEAYARQVIEADFEEKGDDDVIRKVLADMTANDLETTAGRLRIRLDKCQDEALRQIQDEIESGQQHIVDDTL
ncbi:DUF1476 domain-containing protein [Roseospirillum parvum]|uniref:Aldolase n=1 Tax=Roseospirillum parvum TaxID=83401 RepID=A0A1G7ULD9_9PROT|nr:DUF1476 domain-containing protein [Roseospirillum parvum]SDG48307.1 hypothetical protein SAMN05421742_101364 [Roseospirillum parvum]